jgi:hypothetical protein
MTRFVAILLATAALPAAAADRPDPAALAATIDRHVRAGLTAARVPPAPPADDATFFRRVNLALAGRVPVPSEVRAFLADRDPGKRAKAIDRLLLSAASANHFTTVWRSWLLPEAVTSPEVANQVPGFEAWLRNRVAANTPYDRLVTELLTFPLSGRQQAVRGQEADATANPLAFYVAKDGKPENLAAATSRLFLGVQLECAQCHNHPTAAWTREQFWGLAAFYGGIDRPTPGGGVRELLDRRELPIPNTDRTAPATFLDDTEPEWRFKKSPRVTLAAWVTARDNPFFAKAAVNRVWGYLFGVGIVDPVDDFHEQNPPSHPKLLDDLAAAFVESGYDLRFLVRAICLSETYQRASGVTDPGHRDVRLFARFPVQGLSPEQLYDSLSVVIGTPLEGPGGGYLVNGGPRRQFLDLFNPVGKKTDTQTTIIQALALMNGDLVGTATRLDSSRTLAAVVELPGLSPAERVEALYLAALSRPPRPDEAERVLKHVTGGGPERYADVLWALLNGVEFRTNH